MKKKYFISLIIIGILLGICTYLKIDSYGFSLNKDTDSSVVLVDEKLSVNYLDGNNLKINSNQFKTHFSITNMTKNDVYFYINLVNITGSNEKTSYVLNRQKETNEAKTLNDGNIVLLSYENIKKNETISFDLEIFDGENTNFQIIVGYEEFKKSSLNELIMNNNPLKELQTTLGSASSTIEEGLIKEIDEDGVTYYFRGINHSNYLKIGDLLFRIVRINGDGTIRLILNEEIKNVSYYNGDLNNLGDASKYDSSNIKKVLDDWYEKNQTVLEPFIVSSKFCSEENPIDSDNKNIYYLANARTMVDFSPTFMCLSGTKKLMVGTLSSDEVIFAGASSKEDNKDYYLKTDYEWYLMTPAYQVVNKYPYIFSVNKNGRLISNHLSKDEISVRPVININKNLYGSGDGSLTNPYLVSK